MDWDEVRAQAAISALQGVSESGKVGELLELSPSLVAKQSVRLANAIVEELKRNRDNETLDNEIKEEIKKIFKKKDS